MSGIHGSPGRAPLSRALGLVAALLLAGCGAVQLKPDYTLPKPLMQPLSARAGLVLEEELRRFTHQETRGGGDWKVELGPGHDHLFRSMFGSSFEPLAVFNDLESAKAAAGLQVIFRPQIEQYSFATAMETSGYWAVTLRYRISVLSPSGEPIDTLTLTGYGSAYGERSKERSLTAATHAAMRDAAAKFLVQMPRMAMANKLKAGETLRAEDGAVAAADVVEAVPIEPAPAS